MSENVAKIVISMDYIKALLSLSNEIQAQANSLLLKIKESPSLSSLNLEKLGSSDPSIRSARVNRDVRVILSIGDDGKTYYFHYIDHHDAAYRWMERKRIVHNSLTGNIEILDIINTDHQEDSSSKMLFEDLSESKLGQLRIPNDYILGIRSIKDIADLENKRRYFPELVYEKLFLYGAGLSLEELISSYGDVTEHSEQIEGKQQGYFVIDDEESVEEFQAMLQSSIDKWRVFLHPSQEKIVSTNYMGPAKVSGEAGTGKTIVAIHRAKRLAEKTDLNSRILVTTFTSNLSEDIEGYLRDICDTKDFNKIDVMNIDKVVSRFLKDTGSSDRIIYGQDLISLWKQSIDGINKANSLPIDFYQDEWERVIIQQGIITLDQYKLASRTGRGYPLNRKVKEMVWEVMVVFKKVLIQSRMLDINLALVRAIDIAGNLETTPYTHIIIDEMQDFTTSMLTFIRKLVGIEHENDIFLVGDERQSIYGRKLVLKTAGINVVGRSSNLRINYRTTEEIRRWADKILDHRLLITVEGDKFQHEPALSLIHGKKPTINVYQTKQDESIHIIGQIEEWIKQGYEQNSICITAKLNKRLDQIKQILNDYGFKTVLLKNSAEEKYLEGIRLGTMHRIKGKEFNCVIIAGLEDGTLPSKAIDSLSDEVKAKELEQIERSLLYVAVTRAKLEISITCIGKLSRYIPI